MKVSARAAMRLAVAAIGAGAAATAIVGLVVPAEAVPARAAAAAPKCTAAQVGVWVDAGQSGAAAGTLYTPLDFTNLSRRTCTLHGFPGVSAISSGFRELGAPAAWDRPLVAPTSVRLAPDGTAHAWLLYEDVVVGNCPRAYQRTAFALRVYPPDQYRADNALWDFTTCTARGSTHFLLVSAIAPGPGIRGGAG